MAEYIDKLHIGGNDYDIYAVSATSALSASNAEKLQGLPASTFASAEDLNTLVERVSKDEGDIITLQNYFTDGSANSAVNATSASKAYQATSASEAYALASKVTLSATGDATVSFNEFNGSEGSVAGMVSIPHPTSLAPSSDSTATGFAPASATEIALAVLESEIGAIAAFDGPYATTAAIPTPYKTNVIYIVGPSGEGEDRYEEYIAKDGALVKIGTTDAHLSNYYTKTEIDTKVTTLNTAISTEATRAKDAEDVLSEQLTAEISRADAAEKANAAAIAAEETRAKDAEEALSAAIDGVDASLDNHIATTAVHIQTGERDLWNTVSAMATSAEFTALAARVTTAEGEIDTLQTEMSQAQEDISDVSSTVTGMKYYGKIKIGDLETVATTSADTFEISGGEGIAVTTAVGAGHPTIAISNTAVAPTFTGEMVFQ